MAEKAKLVVFDMDGTLYQFPNGETFAQTQFGRTIQQNTYAFIAEELEVSEEEAVQKYNELSVVFNGEVSLGVEQSFGIDRMRFFDATWNVDPAKFIIPEADIREVLESVAVGCALLSSAPRVWVDKALGYMGVTDLFGDLIFTGEPDIRKPSPLVFQQVLDAVGVKAGEALSIGDQELTDIQPARSLGMQTVRIATSDVRSEAEFMAPTVRAAINMLKKEGVL